MPRTRTVSALALCVALAACGSDPKPPPKPVAPPKPPPAPVVIDGTWRGTSTRFRAERRDCPHPGLVTLHVQDRQFEYLWTWKTRVISEVESDGSVHGEAPDITLVGQVRGKRMEGDVTNGYCGLHFTVTKWH